LLSEKENKFTEFIDILAFPSGSFFPIKNKNADQENPASVNQTLITNI
jgi:hypothetical protein